MRHYVGALDQGTTSTRFMVFDRGRRRSPGTRWNTIRSAAARMGRARSAADCRAHERVDCRRAAGSADLDGSGSGGDRRHQPARNDRRLESEDRPALVQRHRLAGHAHRSDRHRARTERQLLCERTGLPPATYFSGAKMQWILDNVDGVRAAAGRGEAVFGNIDTWVIWNLTGGARRRRARHRRHQREPDDADGSADARVGRRAARSCSGFRAECCRRSVVVRRRVTVSTRRSGPVGGEVPVSGDLGDQQAATVGQVCVTPGEAKNTYGTGNFMLLNTGETSTPSKAGLLTTVCYKLGDAAPIYALEGSIAVTGSAVQWLRDQLGIIASAADVEALANTVPDNGGIYFVPAFSGLFAPYWRSDARGAIVGLSRFNTKAHLARATLEAICFQTRAVLDAMVKDSGVRSRC